MDLRCRKTKCKFNKDLTCMADKILISEKYLCESYKKSNEHSMQDFSSKIFSDETPKIADYRHLKNACLNCRAKCLFNDNGECFANGITVNGTNTETAKCITFMKP